MVIEFVFPSWFFTILYLMATGYLTFLTTKGPLTDNRKKSYKRINKRGWLVVITFLAILFILLGQELNNERIKNLNEKALMLERDVRDSLVQQGIEAGVNKFTKRLFDDLSGAFARQGLKLDTLNEYVTKLEDFSKLSQIEAERFKLEKPNIFVPANGIILTKYGESNNSNDIRLQYCIKNIGGRDALIHKQKNVSLLYQKDTTHVGIAPQNTQFKIKKLAPNGIVKNCRILDFPINKNSFVNTHDKIVLIVNIDYEDIATGEIFHQTYIFSSRKSPINNLRFYNVTETDSINKIHNYLRKLNL